MNERAYTTRRYAILLALTELLKQIDGTGTFLTDLANNVHPRLLFWDEIDEFPAVHLSVVRETREYQGGGFKERFLNIRARCYVKDEEEPALTLEKLLEDIETVIEQNGRLAYQDSSGAPQTTQDITVLSIDTDEGVLIPLGVGEILLQVRY